MNTEIESNQSWKNWFLITSRQCFDWLVLVSDKAPNPLGTLPWKSHSEGGQGEGEANNCPPVGFPGNRTRDHWISGPGRIPWATGSSSMFWKDGSFVRTATESMRCIEVFAAWHNMFAVVIISASLCQRCVKRCHSASWYKCHRDKRQTVCGCAVSVRRVRLVSVLAMCHSVSAVCHRLTLTCRAWCGRLATSPAVSGSCGRRWNPLTPAATLQHTSRAERISTKHRTPIRV